MEPGSTQPRLTKLTTGVDTVEVGGDLSSVFQQRPACSGLRSKRVVRNYNMCDTKGSLGCAGEQKNWVDDEIRRAKGEIEVEVAFPDFLSCFVLFCFVFGREIVEHVHELWG